MSKELCGICSCPVDENGCGCPEGDLDTVQDLSDKMEEATRPHTDEELALALTFDEQLQKRFERMFREKWNTTILPRIKAMIQEESAQLALDLGKKMGQLMNSRGEI